VIQACVTTGAAFARRLTSIPWPLDPNPNPCPRPLHCAKRKPPYYEQAHVPRPDLDPDPVVSPLFSGLLAAANITTASTSLLRAWSPATRPRLSSSRLLLSSSSDSFLLPSLFLFYYSRPSSAFSSAHQHLNLSSFPSSHPVTRSTLASGRFLVLRHRSALHHLRHRTLNRRHHLTTTTNTACGQINTAPHNTTCLARRFAAVPRTARKPPSALSGTAVSAMAISVASTVS